MMFGWLGIGGGGAADEVRPFVWLARFSWCGRSRIHAIVFAMNEPSFSHRNPRVCWCSGRPRWMLLLGATSRMDSSAVPRVDLPIFHKHPYETNPCWLGWLRFNKGKELSIVWGRPVLRSRRFGSPFTPLLP